MLQSLELNYFKCFKHLYIPFKPLTLIAGYNGAGKSSIIQSLLLMRQSCLDKDYDWKEIVVLNGDLVDLENAEELLYVDTNDAKPTIDIKVKDNEEEIIFHIIPDNVNPIAKAEHEGDLDNAKKEWPLFNEDFVYLYADRVQPKAKYFKQKVGRNASRLGDKTADNCVFRFAQAVNSNEQIAISDLKHDKAIDTSILRNTTAWINYLMGNKISVSAEETEIGKEAKYIYTISNKNKEEKTLSPLNMPFGHSYLLPIVIAVLTAPVGSLLIIENPESHLHPSAQGRMGELLARCAQAGVQVIVETHSDHLMNGIRWACHEKLIESKNLGMELIGLAKDMRTHIREHVSIDNDGYVDNWIPGFFDEWENALKRMIP